MTAQTEKRESALRGVIDKQRRKIRKIAEKTWDFSGLALLQAHLQTRGCNAVFLWIPKNAGTSCHAMLGSPPLLKSLRAVRCRFPNKGLVTFGHVDYAALLTAGHVSSRFDRTAYKFAFTRNPYDRLISLYFYSQKVDRLPKDVSFLAFCRQLFTKGCEPIGLYNSIGLSQCNPQVRWLENTTTDFLGSHETFEADMQTICDALSIDPIPVPRLNTTKRGRYWQYYCDESRQIVEELYDEDFRTLGYDKQLPESTLDGHAA